MEKNKLYVGNLSWETTENSLQDAFAECGEVVSAKIITDRNTNRSKGFGFVEMASAEAAEKAIAQFDGKDLDGRQIKVNLAKPKE